MKLLAQILILGSAAYGVANTPSSALPTPEPALMLEELEEHYACTRSGPGGKPEVSTVAFDDGTYLHAVNGLSVDPTVHAEKVPCNDPLWRATPRAQHDVLIYNGSKTELKLRLAVIPPHQTHGLFPYFDCQLEAESAIKITGIAAERRLHVEIYDIDAAESEELIRFDYDFDQRRKRVDGGAWQSYELVNGITMLKLVTLKD